MRAFLTVAIILLATFVALPSTATEDDSQDASISERRPGQIDDPGQPTFDTTPWATDFRVSAVPFDEIFSGGVRKDGIPAVDAPVFASIASAQEWLAGHSPVIALRIEGQARAYPLAILTWHEIVNDVLAGVPVAVTFCPLCHTALVYERSLDGQVLDFGVSGNLRFSDLVMYDRQTESWWQQATGQGIVGSLTGARLTFLDSQIISLDQFAAAYPEGEVLSRDTGHSRDYGRNPYPGYDRADEQPFLYFGVSDGRLAPKERVVTLGEPAGEAISFPYTELRASGIAEVDFEGRPVAVFWVPGTVSVMDLPSIDDSADVGSTGVFSRLVDGQALSFRRDGDEDAPISDAQTGSTWDITGRAVDGPLSGTELEAIPHSDHFWFAWAAFVPETSIWTNAGVIGPGDGSHDDTGGEE